MSPKKSGTATKAEGSTAEGGINVTAGDTKIIMSVLRASTAASKPWIAGSVRWDQVSQELGFKNAKVAKDRISQKYGFFDAPATDASTDASAAKDANGANGGGKPAAAKKPTAATKGKGRGKRLAADADIDDAVDHDTVDHDTANEGDEGDGVATKKAKKVKMTSPE
ncbi:hypothetical protein UCREL1_11453 [Eutypa lata UCREL1]|uniref:Uncharacterized protein n=1 Tax=Eutypa lata (strain UCR-EL1) TaxID=1287681 RepID=M7SVP2_EUTLA|nr:hypothetical protein UCREL1_11453 [Eutypa lata UCREL1]